jgi:hypothetical protein
MTVGGCHRIKNCQHDKLRMKIDRPRISNLHALQLADRDHKKNGSTREVNDYRSEKRELKFHSHCTVNGCDMYW